MKKSILKLAAMVFIFTLLVGLSISHAALLGIKDSLSYPDITFNIQGVLSYDYSELSNQGTLTINAVDQKLTMTKNGPEYYLTDTQAGTETLFFLSVTLDSSGNLIKQGYMEEWVNKGDVVIENHTYPAGTLLLSGTVYAFGFEMGSSGANHEFDFLVKDLSGALVVDMIWPTNVSTGIYAQAGGIWDGKFDHDFGLSPASGDKAPVPLPATLLLLGSGLSMVGFLRFKNKRG